MWYNVSMKSTNSTVKTASKDILARCMAQEDIIVEHSASEPTASFDTKNRVLTLPVWQDMDDAMYDMLVGHEVSHALHTPADGWKEFINNDSNRHFFLNVVEDARIERMIKAKFPGLRRDFASAYKSIHEKDILDIQGKDISALPLLDRLNINFKTGLYGFVDVPFSADEQQYVTRMAETETFEDVMTLADELYRLWKDDQDDQDDQDEQNEQQMMEDQEGAAAPSAGGTPDESADNEESNSNTETGNDSDSGISAKDDTDDGESADSEAADSQGQEGEDGGADNTTPDSYVNDQRTVGSTQEAFENAVRDLRDDNAQDIQYHDLPTPNLDQIIVKNDRILSEWTSWLKGSPTVADNASRRLKKFLAESKSAVNHMAQQFILKQAADADKRISVAKTGVLDTVKMTNYRWSEDIFLKNEVVSDGKNHGIVMYLDWSGSMGGILQETIEQLIILAEFCRKVNIPFDVYAFSSNFLPEWITENEDGTREYPKQWNSNERARCHGFSLLHFLSSDLNNRQYKASLALLHHLGCDNYSAPRLFSLGSTPLHEAIVCASKMVPEFQAKHGVQIVNTVFLTDGEGSSMGFHQYGKRNMLRNKRLRKTYEVGRGGGSRYVSERHALLSYLRDETNSNLIGIFLSDQAKPSYSLFSSDDQYQKAMESYKKNNFATSDDDGYDRNFIIRSNTRLKTDALEGLSDDASYTRIKNAFIKGSAKKKASRVIAGQMATLIAG